MTSGAWFAMPDDPGPSNTLIRRFSDQFSSTNPSDSLARGLGAKVAVDEYNESSNVTNQQQFNRLFQSASGQIQRLKPDQEALLAKHYDNLQTAWQGFSKRLGKKGVIVLDGKTPDLKLVFDTLHDASQKLQANTKDSAGGRVREKCRGLFEGIYAHKTVLKILPTDDKYFTLFAGALGTVMQAAVNYGEIRQQIEETLANLFDELSFWDQYKDLIVNQEMYVYVVELYVLVFECLTDIFSKWSSRWDRVKTSLNETSIRTVFEERRLRMRNLREKLLAHITAEKVKRDQIEQRYSRQMQQRQSKNVEELLHLQRQYEEDMRRLLLHMSDMSSAMAEMRLQLGIRQQNLLEPLTHQRLSLTLSNINETPAHQPAHVAPLVFPDVTPAASAVSEIVSKPTEAMSSIDIDLQLKPLKTRLAEYYAELSHTTTKVTHLEIDAAVRTRVLSWLGADHNDILWIEGPPGVSRPSQNTALGLLLSSSVSTDKTHVVHWFCGVESPVKSPSSRKRRLADMISCLLMQVTMLIPTEQISHFNLLHEHLRALQDQNISVPEALTLLKAARRYVPATVMFIIDGLQDLEGRDDPEYQALFIQFIRALQSMAEDSGTVLKSSQGQEDWTDRPKVDEQVSIVTPKFLSKVCFTTDGYVDGLAIAEGKGVLVRVSYSLQADDPGCDETESFML